MYIDEVKVRFSFKIGSHIWDFCLSDKFFPRSTNMKSNLQEFSLVLQVSPLTVKSTAAALANSVAGNPTKGNETLFKKLECLMKRT